MFLQWYLIIVGLMMAKNTQRIPLKGQAAGNDTNILGKTHWPQHLRSEHTTVTDFGPLLQIRVETKDLHRRLSVAMHNTTKEGRTDCKRA